MIDDTTPTTTIDKPAVSEAQILALAMFLHEVRSRHTEAKARYELLTAAADEATEYSITRNTLQSAERNLRYAMETRANQTGDKSVGHGLQCKDFMVVEYDTDEAFGWARKHDLFLRLDPKAFEKYIKQQPDDLDIAYNVTSERRATIPRDLTKILDAIE